MTRKDVFFEYLFKWPQQGLTNEWPQQGPGPQQDPTNEWAHRAQQGPTNEFPRMGPRAQQMNGPNRARALGPNES